jgi:hypothetical protein
MVSVAVALAVGLCAAPSRADDASSRWIAALPFGVGQLHRGDIGLGIFFAAGEAVLGGASIGAAAVAGSLSSTDVTQRRSSTGQHVDIGALNDRIETATIVNRIAFAGWAALAVAGVLEAQVNIGRRRSEPRDQPGPPVGITVAPVPGGASIGLRTAF